MCIRDSSRLDSCSLLINLNGSTLGGQADYLTYQVFFADIDHFIHGKSGIALQIDNGAVDSVDNTGLSHEPVSYTHLDVYKRQIGTVAFACSGAMVAIKKNLDLLGIIVLGVTTAVGGGMIRDILIGIHPPALFTDVYKRQGGGCAGASGAGRAVIMEDCRRKGYGF